MEVDLYLRLFGLLCQMTFLYAVCSNEGRLQTELEWYDDLLSAEFEGNGAVDFKYMVSYSSRDSQEKPIKLVMYLQGKKPLWNSTTSCQQRIEVEENNSPVNQVIVLDTGKPWSGCSISGDDISCQGGRTFGNSKDSKFVISVARCGSFNIQMNYKLTFNGYTKGSCVEDKTDPDSPNSNTTSTMSTPLIVVTTVSVFNSVIIILALVYCVCRRCRLNSRMDRSSTIMNILFDKDDY